MSIPTIVENPMSQYISRSAETINTIVPDQDQTTGLTTEKDSCTGSYTGHDSGFVAYGSTDTYSSTYSSNDSSTDGESDDLVKDEINLEYYPEYKELNDNLKHREEKQKIDRKRNLLFTKLHHLRKSANILVIGPDHAGKTSLINSLGYMIRKDDKGNHVWKTLAEYDLGKSFKYKPTLVWPLDRRNRTSNRVCFFEAGGFEKVGDIEKSATILQYALEGRLTASTLLQMFLLMNTSDITERYREDPNDPRVLEERRIDCILHVTPAGSPPNKALFKLINQAVNQSKDPRVQKIPILTCVTSPVGSAPSAPVHDLKDYDLGAMIKKSQNGGDTMMRRNHSLSRLSMGHNSTATGNICEPAPVRICKFYQPDYDQLSDESDISSIKQIDEIDTGLLQLFDDTLRMAQRENHSMRKRFLNWLNFLN